MSGQKINETKLVVVVVGNLGMQLSEGGREVVGEDGGLGRGLGNRPAFLSWVEKWPTARLSLLEENVHLSIQKVGPAQTLQAIEEPAWDLSPRRS